MEKPLILVTNDDGIESAGLWAAVEAALSLGEVLVVAPDRQWSGGGRSMPPNVTGRLIESSRDVGGQWVKAYAVDASPALTVTHGVLELAPRPPALVISGVNAGSNLGTEVTISGTVGAALEAGAFGIPSLAVSLEMDPAYHLSSRPPVDYAAAIHFTREFARYLLSWPRLPGVDALNLNLPPDATAETEWRWTRLARMRYFIPTAPDRANGKGRPGYTVRQDMTGVSPDTDLWAIHVDHIVSVTPLSLDLTARGELVPEAFGLRPTAPGLLFPRERVLTP